MGKVILRDQALEVRNVDRRLHVARKPRRPERVGPFRAVLRSMRAESKVSADASDGFMMTDTRQR